MKRIDNRPGKIDIRFSDLTEIKKPPASKGNRRFHDIKSLY